MAKGEITGWITVNGQHIPLMKGESKGKAVARFIKGKRMTRNVTDRKKREDDFKETLQREKLKSPTNYLDRTEMLMEDKYGKDWDKTIRNKQKIKGYSDDPYNRVDKAREARLKASRENQWDVDQTRALLHTMRTDAKDHVDSNIDDIYDKQKANPSRLERAKTAYRVQQLNNEYDAKLSDAEYRYASAKAKQSRAMDRATNNELTKEYKGYKLSPYGHTAKETKAIGADKSWEIRKNGKVTHTIEKYSDSDFGSWYAVYDRNEQQVGEYDSLKDARNAIDKGRKKK